MYSDANSEPWDEETVSLKLENFLSDLTDVFSNAPGGSNNNYINDLERIKAEKKHEKLEIALDTLREMCAIKFSELRGSSVSWSDFVTHEMQRLQLVKTRQVTLTVIDL
jgi:hypothetical protein